MEQYFGGIPTDIDIQRLSDSFPAHTLVPGTVIKYDDAGGVINQPYGSNRWKTVTTRWRRKVEADCNIYIEPDPNVERQFIVLDEPGKVGLSRKKLRSSVKLARRSFTISARVDVSQLTEEKRKEHDFNCAKSAAVLASGQLRSNQAVLPEV